MVRTAAIILILCLSLLMTQCLEKSTGPAGIVTSDSVVTLRPGQSALILPDSLKVIFSKIVQDSRCPLSVHCFWPGMAEIELRVSVPGSDPVDIAVGTFGTGESDHLCSEAFGYVFRLTSLVPYPEDTDPIPESQYRAELSISESDSCGYSNGEVIISDLAPSEIMRDPFSLDSIYIGHNSLEIKVNYGGGCKEHDFRLYMSPAAFAESHPPQANLYLHHDGHGDACLVFVHETLSFGLIPIAKLYGDSYGKIDTMQLNLYEYFDNQPAGKLSTIYVPCR